VRKGDVGHECRLFGSDVPSTAVTRKASGSRRRMPEVIQRCSRRQAMCQVINLVGRSRQGAPVRAGQTTVFKKRRWLSWGRPRLGFRGGSKVGMRVAFLGGLSLEPQVDRDRAMVRGRAPRLVPVGRVVGHLPE